LIRHEKGRPHRAAPITTNLCEECRICVLILFKDFVIKRQCCIPREDIKKGALLTGKCTGRLSYTELLVEMLIILSNRSRCEWSLGKDSWSKSKRNFLLSTIKIHS